MINYFHNNVSYKKIAELYRTLSVFFFNAKFSILVRIFRHNGSENRWKGCKSAAPELINI